MNIFEAAEKGDAARVKEILDQDPTLVNAKGGYDKTPLHWAAEKNHKELAALLVAARAEVETETTWGMTPLAWAANMGSNDVAEILLARGARCTMWAAAGLGMLDRVKSFWESPATLKPGAGQSRSRRDDEGRWGKAPPPESYPELISDAFYIAGRNGHIEVMAFLLERGADINCRGFFGGTGLHWAAINGHKAAVRWLLDHGADAALKDTEFDATPHGWALETSQTEIAALLQSCGS